jgi:hypothetical protein
MAHSGTPSEGLSTQVPRRKQPVETRLLEERATLPIRHVSGIDTTIKYWPLTTPVDCTQLLSARVLPTSRRVVQNKPTSRKVKASVLAGKCSLGGARRGSGANLAFTKKPAEPKCGTYSGTRNGRTGMGLSSSAVKAMRGEVRCALVAFVIPNTHGDRHYRASDTDHTLARKGSTRHRPDCDAGSDPADVSVGKVVENRATAAPQQARPRVAKYAG